MGGKRDSTMQPILLLADSQPLLMPVSNEWLLERYLLNENPNRLKAAYIGASNNDEPAFFEMFKLAMHNVGIENCTMISSEFDKRSRNELKEADIILLAGGDVYKGWHVMKQTGMGDDIVNAYYAGKQIIGVSAGAIQLGLYGFEKPDGDKPFETLKLLPLVIDVHDEKQNWSKLKHNLAGLTHQVNGLGIPFRGVMVYYPDYSVEAFNRPLHEFFMDGEAMRENLIMPRTHSLNNAVPQEDMNMESREYKD